MTEGKKTQPDLSDAGQVTTSGSDWESRDAFQRPRCRTWPSLAHSRTFRERAARAMRILPRIGPHQAAMGGVLSVSNETVGATQYGSATAEPKQATVL